MKTVLELNAKELETLRRSLHREEARLNNRRLLDGNDLKPEVMKRIFDETDKVRALLDRVHSLEPA